MAIRTTRWCCLFLCMVPCAQVWSLTTAAAQPPSDPPAQPTPPADESPDSLPDELRRAPAAPRSPSDSNSGPAITIPSAIDPSKAAVVGLRDAASGVPTTRRLREGAFLNRRTGAMRRAPTGDWIFVPGVSQSGAADRPMVVVPSQTLERIEAAMAAAADQQFVVELSGQVLTYRDREYLLPQQPSSVHAARAPDPAQSLPRPSDEPGRPEPVAGQDEAVQDLIRDLEAMRSAAKALTPSQAGGQRPQPMPPAENAAPDAPQRALSPEGTLLTGRRGRVVRMGGGDLAFAVDSDTDGVFDRPMILAPCQTLKRLEDLVRWRGEELVISLSGRVLAYQGRNYLLPTMFVVPPPSDVDPLQ